MIAPVLVLLFRNTSIADLKNVFCLFLCTFTPGVFPYGAGNPIRKMLINSKKGRLIFAGNKTQACWRRERLKNLQSRKFASCLGGERYLFSSVCHEPILTKTNPPTNGYWHLVYSFAFTRVLFWFLGLDGWAIRNTKLPTKPFRFVSNAVRRRRPRQGLKNTCANLHDLYLNNGLNIYIGSRAENTRILLVTWYLLNFSLGSALDVRNDLIGALRRSISE